ncbi:MULTISPECIES: hypothetical protein [Paenibacillus]|uniref:hypothetical protein n=1 Tax=Paenibacillus TaxID=44249 RepID=UPI00073F0F71|nr:MULTISPECIES: hypothetical protein [Paenibacillus]MDU4695093.1 hypothetical protein [Paenibacillus sp.]
MTSSYITLLLLIGFSCFRDRDALREGGALSRWVFYAVFAVSFGILIYVTRASRVFYLTDWLGRVLGPWVPFHQL